MTKFGEEARSKGISLYTASTPNGWKISIMLEEIGAPYHVQAVDLFAKEQRSDAFLKLNPNGRIPVIVDHENDDLVLFESGAILWYLAERFGALLPHSPHQRTLCHQWLMFQMSGVGPMMGQLNVFRRYFPTKLPAVIDRYHNETRRLFAVLDGVLDGQEFILSEHTIADIALWCWVYTHRWSGVDLEDFPNLLDWKRRLRNRPAYQRGVAVPHRVGRMLDSEGHSDTSFTDGARTILTT